MILSHISIVATQLVGTIQSLVINMAINAYSTKRGGATKQYDQKIVRLISRSSPSLVAFVICGGKEGHAKWRQTQAKEEHTCANVTAGGDAIRSIWLSMNTGLKWKLVSLETMVSMVKTYSLNTLGEPRSAPSTTSGRNNMGTTNIRASIVTNMVLPSPCFSCHGG